MASDGVRLFAGVRVSMATVVALTEARQKLATAAEAAGVQVRWVAPATYHITLEFLGWTRPETIEPLRDRIGRALAGRRRFRIRTAGGGAFPSPERARVVWAGIEDRSEGLTRLAQLVQTEAVRLGFPAEKRAFHPHVTLGRTKEFADLSTVLVALAEQNFSETSVESVILFESKMKSYGSEYIERAVWPLQATSKGSKRQTSSLEPALTDDQTRSGED
ncbi:MAG TPA: RNA 2',3'-cyclic phosphodiesterase [Kofleriaceae bacterium]|nr:RNA 2',3'-cyclic phosphodiesterase [Kofleriaceae bacterium]